MNIDLVCKGERKNRPSLDFILLFLFLISNICSACKTYFSLCSLAHNCTNSWSFQGINDYMVYFGFCLLPKTRNVHFSRLFKLFFKDYTTPSWGSWSFQGLNDYMVYFGLCLKQEIFASPGSADFSLKIILHLHGAFVYNVFLLF